LPEPYAALVILRPFFYGPTSCASYLFGCTAHGRLAVVDPHAELVDDYLRAAAEIGSPIVAVLETHLQADHVSGLPGLVEAGATAYLPAGEDVAFSHVALADGERVELGNAIVTALSTPGHAPAHAAFIAADRTRGDEEPWMVFSGDALLVNDMGRPDLHAGGDPEPLARLLHASVRKLLELDDGVLLFPSHYGGSVCGRSLSGNPVSTVGFERRHNHALALGEEAFVAEAMRNLPPPPADQEAIIAANRTGRARAPA
jgi:glyoxylase-like metal-dependent hydrolase (beta-lactamase superfamily II)